MSLNFESCAQIVSSAKNAYTEDNKRNRRENEQMHQLENDWRRRMHTWHCKREPRVENSVAVQSEWCTIQSKTRFAPAPFIPASQKAPHSMHSTNLCNAYKWWMHQIYDFHLALLLHGDLYLKNDKKGKVEGLAVDENEIIHF